MKKEPERQKATETQEQEATKLMSEQHQELEPVDIKTLDWIKGERKKKLN